MPSNPPSVLTGMTQAQLQAALTQAQTAYTALMTGSKGETFSYAQGEGSKSVTYTRANVANLTYFIAEIQRALGIRGRRRAIRFRF